MHPPLMSDDGGGRGGGGAKARSNSRKTELIQPSKSMAILKMANMYCLYTDSETPLLQPFILCW